MTELLSAAQMRAIEQAAIASGKVTGLDLMERAGAGVVEAVLEEWPELEQGAHRAVVLCGPGNNGGDGFVVARLLKERGWEVEVFLYGDAGKLPPDAKVNCERWGELGGIRLLGFPALSASDEDSITRAVCRDSGAELLVDALFGTGLTRPLTGLKGFLVASELHASHPEDTPIKTVAIDMPSGLCADSGKVIRGEGPHGAVRADLTVPFHRAKFGHVLDQGPSFCGALRVKPIGIDQPEDPGVVSEARCENTRLGKRTSSHKYSHGHAFVLSGGFGRTGAARLAARGALRIGAGLVTLGVPGAAQMEVASQITALMVRRVEDADALAEVLEDARFNALCLGPGLGLKRARALVPEAVRAKHAPYVVLDADALTAFSEAPEALFGLLHPGCVLTPHGGEFARLFPDIARRLREEPRSGPAYSKVDATRDAARRAGCTVLFKGPDTVIADPQGRCSVNAAVHDREAPWLATAGSGDVLAGFITGLLARGFAPMQAAETAAWLHVECARSFGPGLIAEDLPEELPKVFRALDL